MVSAYKIIACRLRVIQDYPGFVALCQRSTWYAARVGARGMVGQVWMSVQETWALDE
jgi:hypothetical protein